MNSIKKLFFLAVLILLVFNLYPSEIDTVTIYSKAMRKSIKCVVIKPQKIEESVEWPVVYLLHGYTGNFSNWITKVPLLKQYADEYNVIIVCPDGGYSSWYFDSPVDATMKYETYISKEVPEYIDAHFPTIKNRKARGITGASMGGHGGLFLGFRHANIFGACGSMSGAVDLNASRNKFDINKRIGDTLSHADNWKQYSVINIVEKYPTDSLAIIVDCGTADFFYDTNRALHEKMLQLKIPHDYIERPGKHDWNYWGIAVKYQLQFFRDYFNRN